MKYALVCALVVLITSVSAQTGTEFWVAPPDVTLRHNNPGDEPIYLNVTTGNAAAVVTVSQPANPGFNGGSPIVLNVPANSAVRHNMTPLKAQLETRPTDVILNTGLLIESTADITCYYESSNTNNPDILALKGANGLGLEFYVPLHKHAPFYNHDFTPHNNDLAFASFDIVATENNTEVLIYSPVAVDGHAALTPFTVTLNQGQTYSCANTLPATHWDPATHPSGAVVLADKPVAVSIKDDSNHNPSGGCYDLMLDQIVPIDILGTEYVAVKGQLNSNGDESLFVMAVENNTQVYIDGSATPITTLFAGQYYRHDMDYLSSSADNSTLVSSSKPVYAIHVTGFGCEQGMAILPPLNCAGSTQLSFTRSTSEAFYLNLLVRSGSENDFVVTPGTATIPGSAFQPVPGTGGVWLGAQIQYNTTEVPVNQAFIVSNTSDVFSLAIINGGATSGCRYGFFSEFAGEIIVDAGVDQNLCVGENVSLTGSVSGGSTTGIWTSTGTGNFNPSDTDLNATYEPSIGDLALGTVTLTLTSTGMCTPESDDMEVNFQEMPIADAGVDQDVCLNNPVVNMAGSVLNAVGGVWTGGAGTYVPSNSDLNATYTPTAGELSAGTLKMYLTTTGNGVCPAVTDSMLITFTPAPTANAGGDQTLCANNPVATLNGSFTVATGGIWSGGAGTFDPSTTNMNALYTPTAAEIASGTLTLTLTTTGNGTCNAVNDQVLLTFTAAPTVDAGADETLCENNPSVDLGGSATGATGGEWTGGTGTYSPNNTDLNANYTPSAAELAAGTVTLTLTSTGNGNCIPVTDTKTLNFTPAPIVDAGNDASVCANDPDITLGGSVIGATGGTWSGGAGSYSSNNNDLNAVYTPSAAEITAGTVTLDLTSVGNGNCLAVVDQVTFTITPAPTANAGADVVVCANNNEVTLNGSFTMATGGIWSGGAGSFDPSTTNMAATYTPSAAEITAGSVTLTLTTTGNGGCTAVTDQMTISFTPAPVVNAGADVSLCENNADVTLSGSVTGATGGIWSGGTGTYTPNNTDLNATYSPTAAEIAAGTLTLTLTSTGNGTCNPVSDDKVITFTPAPIADAGVDGTVCANNPAITLGGAVTGATGGTWSGGTGSYSPNANDLNAVYTPSAAEVTAGSVTLTLTTVGNGNCIAVTDQVTYSITPSPTANAGTDQTLCSNNPVATLNGSVTIASGGIWSGGAGTFNPSNTNLAATYTPTAAEIASGTLTLTLTTTGNGTCNAVADQVELDFTPSPTANAGPDVSICENNSDVSLNGSVGIASGGIWSGGLGSFTPNNTTLNATYSPTPAEMAAGTLTLTLTTTGNGNCIAVSDDMTITFTPAPTVDAGVDADVCENNNAISLGGNVIGATGGTWSGGSGSYSPNANDLNAVYTPSASELSAGMVTLTLTSVGNGNCIAVTDQVTYTITPSPTANAGVDQTLCSNNPVATLNGSVTIASGGVWSGGAGTFNPSNTNLSATYTPTAAEIASGTLTLTLTTTGNGNCNAVSDQIQLDFTPSPTANAGANVSVCENNADVALNGSVTVASGGIWSGGLGSFTPNNTTLNATYTPTPAEMAAGTLTLTLTTTGNGNCIATSDDMTITFTPAPTVDAGANGTVCANNATISLSGTVTGAGGGIWSGGAGSYSPNNTSLNASYTPTAAEIAAGTLTLTLTTAGNGNCVAEIDQVTFNFTPAPTANAGADRTVCANNPAVALAGSFSIATGGVWSGGAGTFDPSTTNMSAIYTPTAAEIANGTVTLTLTTTGNGLCNAVTDQMVITITDAPTANAGPDVSVCANNADVALGGSVSIATGGTWSGGTGTFTPNANALNATYTPGAADLAAGQVTLTLTTTGNGSCTPAVDSKTITYTDAPIVDAGADGSVCANAADITLNGSVTGASGGVWSGGSGSFSPNNITLNATYTPSASEISAGTVTLTLTSAGNGNCNAETDQVTYTITPAPTVDAGIDQSLCANNADATLNAITTVATGVIWSGGTGLYSPGNTAQNITYTPSAIEIANGSVMLTVTTTGNGNCAAVSDNVELIFTNAPIANAGPDQTKSANNANTTLAGSFSIATGGIWSGGAGSYNPNNTTMNAIYTPTAAEIAAGFVTLTLTTTGNGACAPESDDMTITFTDAPTADAGPDQTVCANNPDVQLAGSVTVASGGIWSGGNGTYNPNASDLNAIYTPSAGEIAAGTVTLTLTTVGNGNGNPESDDISITITPAPIVDAGSPISICANQPVAQLAGVINNAAGGVWSGGSGTFNPSNTNLNATYTPTLGEIASGTVTLTLTSTGNGLCNAESDQVVITIANSPVVDAGADQTVCANNPDVILNGSVSNAGGGVWSGGTGVFSPSINALNATYTPSVSEINNGSVTLTLTSTNNGSCQPESDQMTIFFSQSPVVDANADQTVCENDPTVQLDGSVTIATGGIWSGGNGAFNPGPNTLNAIYTPSPAEIALGTVTLTLTSTGNGQCSPESDDITITIIDSPVADAGADLFACSNNATVQLGGSVNGAGGGQWSGGAGTFDPSIASLNAIYYPTPAEVAAGTLTLTLTTIGNGNCTAVSDDILITFTASPTANAGVDGTLCSNNADIQLQGSVTVANGGTWSGAQGTFDPDANTLNAVYTPSVGELAAGEVTLILTTTGNNGCNAVSDSVTYTFTPAPIADAGVDVNTCANNASVALNGSLSIATGGIWSGGSGTFSPNNTTLNATYTPSAGEITAGSVTLTLTTVGNGNCNAVSDDVVITIDPSPVVEAGPPVETCANNPAAQLMGSVQNATGGVWSGAGTFSPSANDLSATYTPTVAEVAAGTATVTLTSTGNGLCNAESDQVVITITPAPVVDAGPAQVLCANNADVLLAGNVQNATGGSWTGGAGAFSPSSNDLNAVYTPSVAEISSGSIWLYLTSTGNGGCLASMDSVNIQFTPAPTVDAGADQELCANAPQVSLGGSITLATGAIWSGGAGTFTPTNTDLNATYDPTPAELANGQVTLVLTTTGVGNCNAVSDSLMVTFDPQPVVNAGPDQQICANNPVVDLSGFVGNAPGGEWTGGAGTYFPSNTSLVAQYTPTSAEIAAGTLTLTLSSTGTTVCASINDDMIIDFTDSPIVDAGTDQFACENNPKVQLTGNVLNASGGSWSGGNGIFTPSNAVLSPQYEPTAAELAAGTVTLYLTSTGNGNCIAVQDTLVITYTPAPTVDAGADLDVCANNPLVNLNGAVTVATGGQWSGGLGTFIPNDQTLNAQYIPSTFELQSGSVTLTLTTTGNGNCIEVSDDITITVTDAPFVDAGADTTVCSSQLQVDLNGVVQDGSTTGIWSTNGTGTFFPTPTTLNATYMASSLDSLNGSVILTLTSTNNGLCNAEADSLVLTILPNAIADAGVDQVVCASDTAITLNGTISGNATQGTWTTTGAGSFLPDANAGNAIYEFAASDADLGTLTFTWSVNSCDNASDDMTVDITPLSQVDAGPDQTTCYDDLSIVINGSVSGASSTGVWSTTGTGTFQNGNTSLSNVYVASSADSLAGSVDLILTSTNTGVCATADDTVHVFIQPFGTVDAGPDMVFCANNAVAQLNGTLGGQATQILWTTSGTGVFVPSNDVLTPTYIPSSLDTSIGSVTLTLEAVQSCNNATDDLIITLTPAPYVNAGPDQTYCNQVTQFNLNGVISGITTVGEWTTTGTGTIGNPNALNTTYTASAADVLAGQIDFVLTSMNNQDCNPVTDGMTIWLTDGLVVDAGPDQNVCALGTHANLQGNVINGSPTGIWTTTGSGTFQPAPDVLNAEYHFSAADVANGLVVLTLTATNTGTCPTQQDQMMITFGSTSFADAGADQTVCANSPLVQLAGNYSGGASGIQWTTSGTGTFSNSTDPNATYSLSGQDITVGSVDITLTTITDGTCAPNSATMTVTVQPTPNILAGADIIACSADPIQLNANAVNAPGGAWTTTGTGTFLDPFALSTLYIPSQADSLAGSVTLTVTTTGMEPCSADSDDLVVSFGGGLSADAGQDVVACSTSPDIVLNGIVAGTTTGVWTTSGTGSFMPSASDLNATYVPGAADFAIGTINLILSTTNNAGCPAATDTLMVEYHVPPTADAGADVLLCDGLEDVVLAPSVQNQSSVSWLTLGSGTFTPSDTVANATYVPSANDSITGGVYLILTAYGTGTCGNASDSILIDIGPEIIADAGLDLDICATGDPIQLNGSVTGADGGIWTTNGTGSFLPDNTNMLAAYAPSQTDMAFQQLEFILTTTGNQGCPADEDTLFVNLQPVPTVDAGPDVITCDASGDVQLAGAYSNAGGIVWSTSGSGSFVPDEFSTSAIYQPSAGDSLMQVVELILTTTGNGNCLAASDTMTLSFINPIDPAFTVDNACVGSVTVFTDASTSAGDPIIGWTWDFGNGETGTGPQATTTYDSTGVYVVTLTVFAQNGCSSIYTEVVEILEAPTAGFTVDGDFFTDSPITIIDQSAGATNWQYDFGDGSGSLNPELIHFYEDPGQYIIIQTVTNAAGCSDSDSLLISIEEQEIHPPKLPNAFSPNGDGNNDVFYVRGGPFESIHLRIYNGWGQMVFETKDPEFGWDGTHNGRPEINGVYVYSVVATTTEGETFDRSGKVTLVR